MKNLKLKRMTSLLLALCLCFSIVLTSCGKGDKDTSSAKGIGTNLSETLGSAPSKQLGIYVKDGVIMLGDKPFYGIGTNYYEIAYKLITDPIADDFEAGIKKVKEQKIPYIRVRFSSYAGEGMDVFYDNPAMFFRGMDRVVELCEQYKIGIIADLAWTLMPYKTEGQTTQDFITTADGEGFQKMISYMQTIVKRYKNSPAIWGWEVGNEFNLACSVAPENLDPQDLGNFFEYVMGKIKEADGTDRMITTGNSQNRHAQKNLWKNGNWTADTLEETKEMLEIFENQYSSIISTHVYQNEQILGGQTVNVLEYLKGINKMAQEIGKPLFIGEYCDDSKDKSDQALSLDKFQRLHDAIMESGIQMATIWIQDNYRDLYMKTNSYIQYELDCAKSGNEKFIADGKQDLDNYWNGTTNVVYKG